MNFRFGYGSNRYSGLFILIMVYCYWLLSLFMDSTSLMLWFITCSLFLSSLSFVFIGLFTAKNDYYKMKNNLRVERAIKDITQEDLANKIGVSRQTINSIESGRYVPSTVLALKIAKVFGKTVEEVFILEKKD